RHTRFSRDWSSDVCSSDLGKGQAMPEESFLQPLMGRGVQRKRWRLWHRSEIFLFAACDLQVTAPMGGDLQIPLLAVPRQSEDWRPGGLNSEDFTQRNSFFEMLL